MKKTTPGTPGHRLRKTREDRDITPDNMAAISGISRAHIVKVELGQDAGGRRFWEKMSEILKVSIDYLRKGQKLQIIDRDADPPSLGQFTDNVRTSELLRIWGDVPEHLRDLALRTLGNFAELPVDSKDRGRLTHVRNLQIK